MSRRRKGPKLAEYPETEGGANAADLTPEGPAAAERLFPESHKEQVVFTLESHERLLNTMIQKTLDTISKKQEELESLGVLLKGARKAKEFVVADFPGPEEDLMKSQDAAFSGAK